MLAGPIDRSANSEMYHPSMVDTNGWGWSIRLVPLFSTTREAIGVHPDGGLPGTLGCIGIALSSVQSFGNRLIDCFFTHDFMRVWVTP
jgi:hypothetical protein